MSNNSTFAHLDRSLAFDILTGTAFRSLFTGKKRLGIQF